VLFYKWSIEAHLCAFMSSGHWYREVQDRLFTCASISHRQWSTHFFTETANQPRRNPKRLKKWKIGANESNPSHIHHTKGNLPASPYKQRIPSWPRRQVFPAASREEIYLAQTEATGNDAHQNVMATWTEVKTLQTLLSYTNQYSNQFGPMEYNCEILLPHQT
jgi:hypothetical protein